MKQRHTALLLCISVPICVILRIIQLFFTIDNTTGFIKPQYSAISLLITVIVCAAIAAVSLLSVFANEKKQAKGGFNIVFSAISLITGIGFLHQTVVEVATLKNNRTFGALLVLATVAMAVVLIMYGIKDIISYEMPSVVLIVFPIYYIIKLISLFINISAIALITQNVFLIFTNCVLLLFMYELAGFENQIGDMSKKPKRIYAYGVAAAMLCGVTSLPELALVIIGKTQVKYDEIASTILNIFIGIFVIAYILCNFKDKGENKKTVYKHCA